MSASTLSGGLQTKVGEPRPGLRRPVTPLSVLMDHYRKHIAVMRDDVKSFESGKMSIGEMRDGQRVDTTEGWVGELRRRIADLQSIIEDYEHHGIV
jgi:hypothetical protein